MLSTLIWVTVGAFIGWNLPQPQFAADAQDWVLDRWDDLLGRD